jgi:serine/threonine-protein kinase
MGAVTDEKYREACRRAVDQACERGEVSLEFENRIAAFIRSGPQSAEEGEAFYRLGRLYLEQGFPENAAEALAKLVALDPAFRDAAELLASLRSATTAELPELPEPPRLPDPSELLRADDELQGPVFDLGATIADRYRLEERIGAGGTSVVFRARDALVGSEVALKLFTQAVYDEETDRRFRRELSLSRQVTHPNVVRLYDIGFFHGFRYITMELLSGSELRSRMRSGPLPIDEGLDYLIQACAGLHAAHERGVIHRDVKPENCYITRDGRLKVMDFGIAKLQAATGVTATGMIAGTAAYMAPEQAMNFRGVTASADVYSLGVVAYELFTGSLPFQHPEMMPLLLMHSRDAPPPPRARNPAIPETLEQVVLRCLEKEPGRRFASCRALAGRLAEIRGRH